MRRRGDLAPNRVSALGPENGITDPLLDNNIKKRPLSEHRTRIAIPEDERHIVLCPTFPSALLEYQRMYETMIIVAPLRGSNVQDDHAYSFY